MPTVSVTVLTRFQLEATALTVTLKPVKALWAVGVPVLPLAVPGAAVSPGSRICNLANAPVTTLIAGLLEAVLDGSDTSDAVKVALPTVLHVTLKVLVPEERVVLAGNVALGS